MTVLRVPLAEAVAQVLTGRITNAAAVAGICAAAIAQEAGWAPLRPTDAPGPAGWTAPSRDGTEPITAPGGRRLAPARVVRGYLDHLAVERGVATNTLLSYRRDLGRYVDYLDARGLSSLAESTRRSSADSWPTCATATTTIRRCRPPRRRGPWWRCAGCTGSRCATVSCRVDVAHGVRPPAAAAPAAEGDQRRRRRAAARRGGLRRHPARDPRPRAAGAALRHRRADLRGGRARRRRPRSRRAHGAAAPARAASSAGCRWARSRPGPCDAYLVQARPALAGRGPGHADAVPQRPRRPAVASVGLGRPADRGRARRAGRGNLAAHAAALLRDASAGGRSRRPGRAGTARPRVGDDDADLHPGHGRSAARGLCDRASARSLRRDGRFRARGAVLTAPADLRS